MNGAFLAGVIAGYGIAVPVGGIGVLIVGLSARISLRVGAAAGLGAATADGIYALVAVAGGAAVARVVAPIAEPLRWTGATVLLALAAWTAWTAIRSSGVKERDERPATPLRAYLGVLGLTLLNPATVIYFAALVVGGGAVGDAGGADGGVSVAAASGATASGATASGAGTLGAGGGWFVTGAFLASASWQLLIAGGGSLIGRLLTSDRGRLITALVSSLVITSFALHLLLTA
ncbi:LysE family transporter [Actinoplanes derwentensis]|uniref:Arginine exporter protein ArgO n=1 Tax=Actinoplanes derwentensis TaxID=113562 RepID=A0A1H2BVK7_9ACTN|nr:LysE family transporter [Actinoplanes derwentensis]GID83108.1 lysine transporter LysE [Actinoplanes derwentensis]SDT61959.1 Arginine exporter protein ArgO [Actinoplanes derwentensis]